jgi:membrane-anchored mycosin MYCP
MRTANRFGPRARLIGLAAGMVLAVPPTPVWAQPGLGEPVGQCTPPSETPISEESWAQRRLDPTRVWPLTRGDVLVGVVDTGVSAAAPALAGAVRSGTNLVGGRGDDDCFGRGTFIAALIAARPSGSDSVPFAGIAPDAQIFPVRVSDNPPRIIDHAGLSAAIGDGIRACVDAGAKVVAVGLVSTIGIPQLDAAVAYAAERDVLVVAPAAVPRSGQLAFPARIPGVLAVAPIGADGTVPNVILGADPKLAAPAQDLVGVSPRGGGQRVGSGNELAVGYVAGAAALVRAYHPGLSARQVAERLYAGADQPSTAVPDKDVGYGVVEPFAAVTLVPDADLPRDPPADDLTVPQLSAPDHEPSNRALWLAGIVTAVALLVAGPAAAAASRRRRAE